MSDNFELDYIIRLLYLLETERKRMRDLLELLSQIDVEAVWSPDGVMVVNNGWGEFNGSKFSLGEGYTGLGAAGN